MSCACVCTKLTHVGTKCSACWWGSMTQSTYKKSNVDWQFFFLTTPCMIIHIHLHTYYHVEVISKKEMSAGSWMDKTVVTVMSTTSQPETGTVLRWQKDGTRVTVPCPLLINYNQFMGGIDRGDQVRGFYTCRTKCRKFYKYIFHFLLDVATAAVHHSPHSNPSGCSWQASWLVTFAVDDGLVVVLLVFSALSLFVITPQLQRTIPARRQNTKVPDVTDATVQARGTSTRPGTAISASFGCAIQESGTLFYAVAYLTPPRRD